MEKGKKVGQKLRWVVNYTFTKGGVKTHKDSRVVSVNILGAKHVVLRAVEKYNTQPVEESGLPSMKLDLKIGKISRADENWRVLKE